MSEHPGGRPTSSGEIPAGDAADIPGQAITQSEAAEDAARKQRDAEIARATRQLLIAKLGPQALITVDEPKAAGAGIRKLAGKHLILFTDLPPDHEVDLLPQAFDQAFPQWCEFFAVDRAEHADWRLTGFLMQQADRFRTAGLLPDEIPPFTTGFSVGPYLWLCEQQSAYYRRHLLLHEGTHAFMNTMFGSCGPRWYMEAVAELLATHRWDGSSLQMNVVPANAEQWPLWGRVRVVREARAEGQLRSFEEVMAYAWPEGDQTTPYAWCWAAALLLDHHPSYRDVFRQLHTIVHDRSFNRSLARWLGPRWPLLCEEWLIYIDELDYGYDVQRTAIDFSPGKPLPAEGAHVTVAADRGWQNSGFRLQAGVTYRLEAAGRYQVAQEPVVWWCEPNGVSIRYWRGRPLGVLLAAVRPDQPAPQRTSALLDPLVVGLAATLTARSDGTLFFRVNDSPAELADNAGQLTVQIAPGNALAPQ